MRKAINLNKRKRKPRNNEESEICKALWTWFFYRYPKFRDDYLRFEVRQTSKIQQAILKAEGNKRGTNDVLITAPNDQYIGLWLEVKTKRGRATDNQTKFQIHMAKRGFDCAFGYGITECKQIIEAYMATAIEPDGLKQGGVTTTKRPSTSIL